MRLTREDFQAVTETDPVEMVFSGQLVSTENYAVVYYRQGTSFMARPLRFSDELDGVGEAMRTLAGTENLKEIYTGVFRPKKWIGKTFKTWASSGGETHHYEQVQRYVPWERETADIDEALWPTISLLWSRGVRTTGCCEGSSLAPWGPDRGYLVYIAEDHDLLMDVLPETVLKKVSVDPGPATEHGERAIRFHPVRSL